MNSPLNAMFEQTNTRRPAVRPKRKDLSCELRMPIENRHPSIWVSKVKHPKHLHAVERDCILFVHHTDMAKAEGFGQRLNDDVMGHWLVG